MPARRLATAWATRSSQGSPARATRSPPGPAHEFAPGRPGPPGAHGDDVPGPAVVRHDDVGAAPEQQQRTPALVGVTDGGDQFGGVLDLDQPVRRPADPERGEAGQRDPESNLHDATLTGTTLRTGERGQQRPQA